MSLLIPLMSNTKTKNVSTICKNPKILSKEDIIIVSILEKLKNDLDYAHNGLDQVIDPILIDSYIFEINSINMKYKYYLNLCKERNLIADGFN